jgi:hypothetical protein
MSSTPTTEEVSILEQFHDATSVSAVALFPIFPPDSPNIPTTATPVQLTAPDGNLVNTDSFETASSVRIGQFAWFNQDITVTPESVVLGQQPQLPIPSPTFNFGIPVLPDYQFYTYQSIPVGAPPPPPPGGGTLTANETAYANALIGSGALSSGTPFLSTMAFDANNHSLFGNAIIDASQQTDIVNAASAATTSGTLPLAYLAGGVAGGLGGDVAAIATSLANSTGISTFAADIIGVAIVAGGFLHAFDQMNGTHTLALAENRLRLVFNDMMNG